MEPGRELDALIAEKVMGCRPEADTSGDGPVCGCIDRSHSDKLGWLKEYSTDIAAAWEVVEKLRSPSKMFFEIRFEDKCWSAQFYTAKASVELVRRWYGTGLLDSAPHAICLAALKAVGAG